VEENESKSIKTNIFNNKLDYINNNNTMIEDFHKVFITTLMSTV